MVTYDIAQAWRNLMTGARNWTVMGIGSDSSTYQLALGFAPGPVSAFPYTAAVGARVDLTTTFTIDGVGQAPFESRLFYDAATYGVFGEQSVTDSSCSTAVPGAALPAAVSIGAGGALYDTIDFETCVAPSVQDGTSTVTWTLESEAGNALFCFNVTERTTGGAVVSTASYCGEVATDGTLGAKARVTIDEGGVTVTMRN